MTSPSRSSAKEHDLAFVGYAYRRRERQTDRQPPFLHPRPADTLIVTSHSWAAHTAAERRQTDRQAGRQADRQTDD